MRAKLYGLEAILLAGALLICSACSGGNFLKREKNEPVIWHVTDLHYISRTLVEDEDYFVEIMSQADGKVTHYVSELYAAFEAQALRERPEAIVFSGDLTLNGAPESHRELAEKLRTLKDAGIAVLVIPGNHDISLVAYKFTKDGVDYAEGTDPETFKEIYADFGYNDAVSADESSFSYLYQLSDGTRLMMLDSYADVKGSIQESTLKWVKKNLSSSRWTGHQVIGVTHQNLLVHNPRFTFGYVLNNAEALEELYQKYHVTLNLSGHMHNQHIAEDGEIHDVAGSSISVCPNQFGVLNLKNGGEIDYHTEKVDVSAWARESGCTDENLLNFEDFTVEFFNSSNSQRLMAAFDGYEEKDKDMLVELVAKMNRQTFAGHIEEIDEELLSVVTDNPSFAGKYIQSLQAEIGKNYNIANFRKK